MNLHLIFRERLQAEPPKVCLNQFSLLGMWAVLGWAGLKEPNTDEKHNVSLQMNGHSMQILHLEDVLWGGAYMFRYLMVANRNVTMHKFITFFQMNIRVLIQDDIFDSYAYHYNHKRYYAVGHPDLSYEDIRNMQTP